MLILIKPQLFRSIRVIGTDSAMVLRDIPTERDPMLAKAPPKDKFNLVYNILLINGLGVLLPWNMFITIAPQYYVDHWFTYNGTQTDYGKNFMSAMGISSQLPNLTVNIINIFLVIGGSLLLRIIGPLILNCFNVVVVIVLIAVVSPSEDAMGWFYAVTLTIIVVLNASNGLYQNSIFGLTADFPQNYTNAIVLGNNLCGIFTTVLNMACTLMITDDIRLIALIYFSISLVTLITCGVAIVIGSRQEFYRYYIEAGERAREAENTSKPTMAQYLQCFKSCWVQFFNVFFTFFVTLTIFPAMMTSTPLLMKEGADWDFFIPQNIYVTVTTFLSFNVFAVLGSFTANFIQIPSERFLWIPVALRGLLIPFFALMNYRPDDRTLPVIFSSPYWFIFGGMAMAYTHGYFSSLGMMYAPRVVHGSLSKIAGMTAAMCLILGLFSGVSFTLVVSAITTTLKI